jgi:hypothetical protein
LRSVIDRPKEEVCDGAGMAGLIPLNFDGVTFVRRDGVDTGGNRGAVDVTGDVIGGYVGDRGVGRRHADTDLISRCFSIDPELVEVLVS